MFASGAGGGAGEQAAYVVLLTVAAMVKADGGSLVVACPQPMVARMLSLTGAGEMFPVAGSVEEALALG